MFQDVTDKARAQRENASAIESPQAAQADREPVWSTNQVFARLACALARGYAALYCVDLSTGAFLEYRAEASGALTEARRGADFFAQCQTDAEQVHPEDRSSFLQSMDPCFLAGALEETGRCELVYRTVRDGAEQYVKRTVSRSQAEPNALVIADSNVDRRIRLRHEVEQLQEERTIYARLHALTGNFICVYVVDPVTDRYREFSATDRYVQSFAQARSGTGFFETVRTAAHRFTHPEDLERFLASFTREQVLSAIQRDGIFTLCYRVLMQGRPLHVQMNAALVEEQEDTRLIVGLNDIDAEYRQREIEREIVRQKEVYDQITASLAGQYDTLYYIDTATNTYSEISSTDEYKKLNVPATGSDFFTESRRSIRKYVHPEDQEKALGIHFKDVMLENLKNRSSFSLAYRLVVNGQVRHIRHTEIMAGDGKHIIVCIKNIDAEVQANLALKETQKKSVTYTQIAERLASHFDFIYYIDCASSRYAEFSTKKKSGELRLQQEGEDFFAASRNNIDRLIYVEDRNRIRNFLDRDYLLSQLESTRQLTVDYRMVMEGSRTQFTRLSVTYSSDHSHFIICVENRDKDVRREQEHLAALSMANNLARRDELTRTKNKTAYREVEKELQQSIERGEAAFGLVVCDINGLKVINDTEGHRAGDDYIKSACRMICRYFRRSPVFRIGGDEFVVLLSAQDLSDRDALLRRMMRKVEENIRLGEGPVVAAGMAVFHAGADSSVEDVFNRADGRMYDNKARLKEQKLLQESHSMKEKAIVRMITEERRTMLDALFKAFEVVSEGTYVFLCDMKYDYSRWSKTAVDTFGLPAEYMYGAGDIWENCIHPEDRSSYHKGIDEIFAGNAAGHDMQYRARRLTGTYDVCTCRGVVIRDYAGEPDYFAGTIRNHGIQGHIDTLTGLRNQYGFFEDLDSCIKRSSGISVMLFGISKFSQLNEMYGYHFGNRALQIYARKVFESVGNTGHTYRIDGTKFAIISNTLSVEELRERYERFRSSLREEFRVDGRKVLLDLHSGALRVDHFDVDAQTVYACLNYADEESKLRRSGDLVEFRNDLNEENHQRLEKLHAIRASIMRGFEGFYLLYQPVVDAQTEELIGAEALLRWRSSHFGIVPPNQFIPILETNPLYPELGEWILREALLAAKPMLRQNPRFVVNVNLSYSQMEKPGFADMVLRLLEDLDYPPEHLCLEVTERCRLLDLELLKNVVVHLKSRGILVALDDFGTGFSAVGILKEMPMDIIKIDRGFVQTIEQSGTDRQIIQSIVGLASIFGAKVCVEGIETPGMRDILRHFQVSSFQGYYYARPLPLKELLAWKGNGQ